MHVNNLEKGQDVISVVKDIFELRESKKIKGGESITIFSHSDSITIYKGKIKGTTGENILISTYHHFSGDIKVFETDYGMNVIKHFVTSVSEHPLYWTNRLLSYHKELMDSSPKEKTKQAFGLIETLVH